MPRNYVKKPRNKPWNEGAIARALREPDSGDSWGELAEQYGASARTLKYHNKDRAKGTVHKYRGFGRKAVFTSKHEAEIRTAIIEMADVGVAPSVADLCDVKHYVEANRESCPKAVKRFLKAIEVISKSDSIKKTNVIGAPGPDWASLQ